MTENSVPIRQYCLALDFDLTMTDIHSNGKISLKNFYWKDLKTHNTIVYLLEKFKNLNWGIYVVTRNIQSDVKKYLDTYGFSNIIDDIYGAKNLSHMYDGTRQWACYKTEFLNEISCRESLPKSNIYFFDDTQENILVAKSNGFVNSKIINLTNNNNNESNSEILAFELNYLLNKYNK